MRANDPFVDGVTTTVDVDQCMVTHTVDKDVRDSDVIPSPVPVGHGDLVTNIAARITHLVERERERAHTGLTPIRL